ncbi:MAG TPA: ribonuclease III [candidate division WOR-3 bacterium]|uniref:Ribonuclease 3 n=1 Tax=candidate division WOR-3 bacterium TaxID=2052148 RepID=A0A7C5DB00_UNCW3|nr:ribonuclease III [Candidatus Aminicenantes bacterium]HHE04866.1 ribonuclease III [candidate division WOR-3 bacterium]
MRYEFKDRKLLERALTHPSYSYEKLNDPKFNYERLEFLGDSIINFVLSKWLFLNFPNLNEGYMSKIKAALASKEILAEAAIKLGLKEKIRLSRGEEKSGGRERSTILSDVFEAFVAAVFLDGGLEEAERIIHEALKEKMMLVEKSKGLPFDYRSALQEFLTKSGNPPPRYEVIAERGPHHRREFVVKLTVGEKEFIGSGPSKRDAMYSAAKAAWENIVGKEKEIIKDKFFLG